MSLNKKLGSFIESAGKHIMGGFKNVPLQISEARLNICKGCDEFKSENVMCNVCGCFLNVKTKWPYESCPLNKWGEYTETKKAGSFSEPAIDSVNNDFLRKSCSGCGGK